MQLQPSLVVNHAVHELRHEIMVTLQRSSRIIHTSGFMKSKDGKRLVKLTDKLFNRDLAFSANQVLMSSKLSLKAFNLAQKTADEMQYQPGGDSKDQPTSKKKH